MKDIFKLLVFFLLIFLSYHIFFKGFVNYEGLENQGVAVGAGKLATELQVKSVSLHDSLLITKYRKDYDNVIMNWENYIHNLMLETVLNADLQTPLVSMERLNTLNKSLESLASVQEYVDSVK